MPDPTAVNSMFARIAGRYDVANRLLSGGIDLWWRRCLIKAVAGGQPRDVLDLATGSGDGAFALARGLPEGTPDTGMDFCPPQRDEAVQQFAHAMAGPDFAGSADPDLAYLATRVGDDRTALAAFDRAHANDPLPAAPFPARAHPARHTALIASRATQNLAPPLIALTRHPAHRHGPRHQLCSDRPTFPPRPPSPPVPHPARTRATMRAAAPSRRPPRTH